MKNSIYDNCKTLPPLFPVSQLNGRFRSGIWRFIYFFTHVCSPGVPPGQYESRFSSRSWTNFFFKQSYLFQLPKKPLNGRFRSGIWRCFFLHSFVPQEYTLVNIRVVSALVPEFFFFFFKQSYLFKLLTSHETEGSGAESRGLYFLSHMFILQEYTLVNTKVGSALVPEQIFFSRKVIYLSCWKSHEMEGSGAESGGLYFLSHMFIP